MTMWIVNPREGRDWTEYSFVLYSSGRGWDEGTRASGLCKFNAPPSFLYIWPSLAVSACEATGTLYNSQTDKPCQALPGSSLYRLLEAHSAASGYSVTTTMAPIPVPVMFSSPSRPVKKPQSLPVGVTRIPNEVPRGPITRFREAKGGEGKPSTRLSKRIEQVVGPDHEQQTVPHKGVPDIESIIEPGGEENNQHPTVSRDDITEMYRSRKEARSWIWSESTSATSVSSEDANNAIHNGEQGVQAEQGQLREREAPDQAENSADPPLAIPEGHAHTHEALEQQPPESHLMPAPGSGPSAVPAAPPSSYPWLHIAEYNHDMKNYVGATAVLVIAALIFACASCVLVRRRRQKCQEQRGRFGVEGAAGRRRGSGRRGCLGCCGGRREQNAVYSGKGLTGLEHDDEAFEPEAFATMPQKPIKGSRGTMGDPMVETVGKWDDGRGMDKKTG